MDRDNSSSRLVDLVERHYALVYRYAYRLSGSEADAEDLTQQAFLVAQAKLDQLRDDACAWSWLCTIVRNAYLKELRTKGCVSVIALEHVAEPAAPRDATGAFAEGAFADGPIDREQLQSALNDLPEEFRTAVILFYFEEFSYKAIAEHLGIPLGTVMSRLARGKAFLRQRLVPPDRPPQELANQDRPGSNRAPGDRAPGDRAPGDRAPNDRASQARKATRADGPGESTSDEADEPVDQSQDASDPISSPSWAAQFQGLNFNRRTAT